MDGFEEPDEAADVSDDERFFSMLGGQSDLTDEQIEQIEQDVDFLNSIPDTANSRVGDVIPGDVIDDYVHDAQFDQVITDYTEDAAFDEVIDDTDLSVNVIPDAPSSAINIPDIAASPEIDLALAPAGMVAIADSDINTDITDFEDDAAFDEVIGEERDVDADYLDENVDADYLDDANFDEVIDDTNFEDIPGHPNATDVTEDDYIDDAADVTEDDYIDDAAFDEVINDLDIIHTADEDANFDEVVEISGVMLSGDEFSSITPQSMLTEGVSGLIQQVHGLGLEDGGPTLVSASPAYSPHLQTKGITSSMQSINLSDSCEVIAASDTMVTRSLEEMTVASATSVTTPAVTLSQKQASPVTTPTSYFNSAPSIIQPSHTFPSDDAATADPSEPGVDSELWVPNSDTLELLRQSSVAPLEVQYLTQASPSNETLFVNPAVELVLKYQGETAAAKLNKPLPATGEDGLRHLIKQGRLMSALNMLTEMLTNTTMSPKIIQLWAIRFALLVKLKLYSNAEVEMSMFGTLETVDLYYEYYPSEWLNRMGSIVPWSMRLLWAILPLHSNSSGGLYGAVDRMYGIVDHLDTALTAGLPYAQEQRVIKYKVSVLVQISGVLAGSGGMQPAIKVLNQLKTLQPSLSNVVTSAMARLFFQLGNIQKGDDLLASVAASLSPEETSMNAGFSSLAHGNYSEAYQHFARVCSINPSNTVASNNGAVCLLYLGRLSDSIAQFESAVACSLHPMLLFNLVSLYELQTASSTNKKCKLLETLTLTDRDGFPYECLRL